MSKTISAGEFKAKCLHLLDVVAQQREELTITKRGQPIARLVPLPNGKPLFGSMKGSVLVEGDLVSPLLVDWDAEA